MGACGPAEGGLVAEGLDRVAVTGGTGSFGQAFVRRLLKDGAERIVIVSRDEVKQGDMQDALSSPSLRFLLGDVRDRDRMRQCFSGCATVVHAAALKRVSSVYSQPEMVKTNIFGTMNVIEAALDAGVERVIVISSDKAVEPTNQYGVTKAAAEGIAVHANSYTYPQGLAVSVVRYGNVMGSRGSVLEVWAGQHAQRQPLTITNPEMSRFLVSLPMACQVVVDAVSMMQGGEIFIPVLPATTIGKLANALYGNWPQTVTGIRPGGEKSHESLLSREERTRVHRLTDRLMLIAPSFHSWTTDSYPVETVPEYDSDSINHLGGGALVEWLAREGIG